MGANPEIEFEGILKVQSIKSIKVLFSFIKEFIQGGF